MNKTYEEIARVAYELYEKRGKGEGYHFDDWVEAERIVLARYANEPVKPVKVVKRRAAVVTAKDKASGDGKPAPKKKAATRKTTAKKKT